MGKNRFKTAVAAEEPDDDDVATLTDPQPEATNGKRKGKIATLTITPPKMEILTVTIRGTSPYVQNRFGNKAFQRMRDDQLAGSTGKKGRQREPKDFAQCYEEAKHVSTDGWCGIPTTGLRTACVDACRLVGFQMTKAKLCIFFDADGYDRLDETPLVKITKGDPRHVEHYVNNANGNADIRARPLWDPGWEAILRSRFDADMFTASDVANLIARVGVQVGIGAGRPNSKETCGCGWGTFEILPE